MTPKINTGGPAFPMPSGDEPRVNQTTHYNEGVSLRDWFAGKSGQPGTTEVYQLRGCPDLPKPAGWLDEHWYGDANIPSRASRYWETLTLDEKYDAYAELRYRIADAMLRAREVRP